MGRQIVAGFVGIAVVAVGFFTAGNGYAGHDDPTGKFCQEMLKQNHSVDAELGKLETEKADWSAMAIRLQRGANDLRAIESTDVNSDVLRAASTLATAMGTVATAPDDADLASIDAAYERALRGMATACNDATGESVGVEIKK